MKNRILFTPSILYPGDLIPRVKAIVVAEDMKGALVWMGDMNHTRKPYVMSYGKLDYRLASDYKDNLIANHGKIVGLSDIFGFLVIKVFEMEYCINNTGYISTDQAVKYMTRYRQENDITYLEAPEKIVSMLMDDYVTGFKIVTSQKICSTSTLRCLDVFTALANRKSHHLQHIYNAIYRTPKNI